MIQGKGLNSPLWLGILKFQYHFQRHFFFKGLDFRSAGDFQLAPVHLRNVATTVIKLLSNLDFNQTYNLCGPTIIIWRGLFNTDAKTVNKTAVICNF